MIWSRGCFTLSRRRPSLWWVRTDHRWWLHHRKTSLRWGETMKYITIKLSNEEFMQLSRVKGDRTWREYIMKDVTNHHRREALRKVSWGKSMVLYTLRSHDLFSSFASKPYKRLDWIQNLLERKIILSCEDFENPLHIPKFGPHQFKGYLNEFARQEVNRNPLVSFLAIVII